MAASPAMIARASASFSASGRSPPVRALYAQREKKMNSWIQDLRSRFNAQILPN
jgi:hypothetical protein